jgi:hypothetical protein
MRIFLFLALTIAPLSAFAEGAARIIDCKIVSACNAEGICAPQTGETRFRFDPVKTNADGTGDYLIEHDGISSPMTWLGGTGPLLWSEAPEDGQTLLFTSETAEGGANMVWHSRNADPTQSRTRFLFCVEAE